VTKTGAAQLQFIGHQTTTATKEQDKSTPDSTRLEAVVAARCRHEEQEQSGDRRSFTMKKPRKRSAGCDEVQQKKILERKETLISSSVYHVTNDTCMHLRHKGSNIYMYRRGRIYKEPHEKYNNRKD
jgi:hypothetical protein